jgi:hypothetical protein
MDEAVHAEIAAYLEQYKGWLNEVAAAEVVGDTTGHWVEYDTLLMSADNVAFLRKGCDLLLLSFEPTKGTD